MCAREDLRSYYKNEQLLINASFSQASSCKNEHLSSRVFRRIFEQKNVLLILQKTISEHGIPKKLLVFF